MDDWEDAGDEFVPAFHQPVSEKTSWEDEDEEEVVVKVAPSAAQLLAAAKKAKEEEIRLTNVLKFAILEDETSDEKRARERKQIEDADAELAGELFGGGKDTGAVTKASSSFSTGIAATTVKSKADHSSFGILCAKKLGDSNSFNIGVFYKSLTEKVQKNLNTETCDEILLLITKVRSYWRMYLDDVDSNYLTSRNNYLT